MKENESISIPSSLSPMDQENMVDLHGLSPARSQYNVNRHLSVAEEARISQFRFVTGRGNHPNARGERGTLEREFPNWLSEENLSKIESIEKGDGYYEVKMKPTRQKHPADSLLGQWTETWFAKNISQIEKLAEEGEAIYQYCLGHCYQYGIALSKDYKKAVEWYQKSAESKNVFAQYALGGC